MSSKLFLVIKGGAYHESFDKSRWRWVCASEGWGGGGGKIKNTRQYYYDYKSRGKVNKSPLHRPVQLFWVLSPNMISIFKNSADYGRLRWARMTGSSMSRFRPFFAYGKAAGHEYVILFLYYQFFVNCFPSQRRRLKSKSDHKGEESDSMHWHWQTWSPMPAIHYRSPPNFPFKFIVISAQNNRTGRCMHEISFDLPQTSA